MNDHSSINAAVLIVAGGVGERAGEGLPKQYRLLAGKPVLRHTVERFLGHPGITHVQVVIHPSHGELYKQACEGLPLPPPVMGGESRQQSVFHGLKALPPGTERVLIHDAARPFVSASVIDGVLASLRDHPAVIPVGPARDAVYLIDHGHFRPAPWIGHFLGAQTPQGFHLPLILQAHERFADRIFRDDGSLVEALGVALTLSSGEADNLKLTFAEDFEWAEWKMGKETVIATGQGFDVHRFVAHPEGAPEEACVVRLGGISIPHTHRLEGHSDADAVLHALTDALLGAAGAGDIGQHFPPSDEKWKGADSEIFLKEALAKMRGEGGSLQHVDVTILCEAPKIGPHRDTMRARLAALLGLPEKRVNVKATTTETLGFTGRREGLAAMAVATVAFKE